jgi:mRNA interferase MazF
MKISPGEVWLADLGIAAKTRPIIIVSRYDSNPPRDLVVYVPCTSQDRGSDYEVDLSEIPFLQGEGVANVQGIGSISTRRLERKLGTLTPTLMQQIHATLRFALDLS